jgi:hypothetical protein
MPIFKDAAKFSVKLAALALFLAITPGCKKAPKFDLKNLSDSGRSTTGKAASVESSSKSAILPTGIDERVEARRNLDSLIRRYERKKEAFERSEASYCERLHLWQLTFAMLELRKNPGTFAGEMPGHEEFIYSDFIEAADNAADALTSYINRYVTAQTESTELFALLATEKQLKQDLTIKFPGSNSRVADANAAMQTEAYKICASEDKEKLKEMFKKTISQLGGDASGILGDIWKAINH